MNNTDAHFESSLPVLEAFSIFDCMVLPLHSKKVEFQIYGEEYISNLAGHYFTGNDTDEEEVLAAKMRAEWGKLMFDLHEWKANHLVDFSTPCLHNLLNVACFECIPRTRGKCFKAYQDKTQKSTL